MPRIRNEFLDSAIYLYRSRHEAEQGIKAGGSGFLVSIPAKVDTPNAVFVYAITNAHVIVDCGATVVRLNTQDDKMDIFEFSRDRWVVSDTDDLAVSLMPTLSHDIFKFTHVPYNLIIGESEIDHSDIGIGDHIFMVGRFINAEGEQKNTPTVRFGNIAQMPGEPIRTEIDKKTHDQESFLCEIHSIGGYSGSPVFFDPVISSHRRPGAGDLEKIKLLGVDWGFINDWRPVCGPDGKPLGRGEQVAINSGLAGVVPGWRLKQFLDSGPLLDDRRGREQIHNSMKLAPVAGAAAADVAIPATPSETTDANA
jgi:hypothetical protein